MNEPPLEPQGPSPEPPSTPVSQNFTHTAVAARVPEKMLRGVFCSGTLILQTQDEFLLDFISTMTQPHQLVARVVMNARTLMQFVPALQANLVKFEQQFGPLRTAGRPPAAESPPPAPPATPPGVTVVSTSESVAPSEAEEGIKPSPPAGPSFHDFYDQLKIPDELLGGAFANAVIIRHTPHEFCFEFIANFFPRSVVTSRIFMAAGRVPSFYDTLRSSMQKYQNRPRER
ncbi:MAG: DUF3467 domain-containing protein [Pirellulales bacterium]|nr:DUF3467 domain-containing protein [Pirellulales bacterium]